MLHCSFSSLLAGQPSQRVSGRIVANAGFYVKEKVKMDHIIVESDASLDDDMKQTHLPVWLTKARDFVRSNCNVNPFGKSREGSCESSLVEDIANEFCFVQIYEFLKPQETAVDCVYESANCVQARWNLKEGVIELYAEFESLALVPTDNIRRKVPMFMEISGLLFPVRMSKETLRWKRWLLSRTTTLKWYFIWTIFTQIKTISTIFLMRNHDSFCCR